MPGGAVLVPGRRARCGGRRVRSAAAASATAREARGVDEQRELRAAERDEPGRQQRPGGEARVARGLHPPARRRQPVRAGRGGHERELGRLRDRGAGGQQRGQREDPGERVDERQRAPRRPPARPTRRAARACSRSVSASRPPSGASATIGSIVAPNSADTANALPVRSWTFSESVISAMKSPAADTPTANASRRRSRRVTHRAACGSARPRKHAVGVEPRLHARQAGVALGAERRAHALRPSSPRKFRYAPPVR